MRAFLTSAVVLVACAAAGASNLRVAMNYDIEELASACDPNDNPIDCNGLVSLFKATGGPSWTFSTGWLNGSSYCHWHGIDCEIGTNRVGAVILSNNSLSGQLPPDVFKLDKMVQFYVDSNKLTGPIPDNVAQAPHLQYLYLNNNQLSGGIPSGMSQLNHLRDLHLSFNQLTGSIEPVTSLPEIVDLYLDHNKFAGSLPSSIGQLNHLQDFYIDDNSFNGAVPSSICSVFPVSRDCNMARNSFACPMPSCVPSACAATCS
mmetsp:Transcript_13291/g.42391  ORF Transcript_13291/g.42391 Transcript_13291/m.42391 type:complete len:260 (+) Transcript_13291:963-1742(+)